MQRAGVCVGAAPRTAIDNAWAGDTVLSPPAKGTDRPMSGRARTSVESMEDVHATELEEHRAAPFPASVEKGRVYGEVEPAMIDADIFGWASQERLGQVQKRSLRGAADQLSRSLELLPGDAHPYFERLLRLARRAASF